MLNGWRVRSKPSRVTAWARETAAHKGAATAAQVSRERLVADGVRAGVWTAVMSTPFSGLVVFGSPSRVDPAM
jgi:hypothetical protein